MLFSDLGSSCDGGVVCTGRLVYHGTKEEVLPFFWRMGFSLPGRVAIADFLQEVTSKSDQHHYWARPDEVCTSLG